MKLQELNVALNIFIKYSVQGPVAYGHDQIWCGPYTASKMHPSELQILTDLGWFEDEESWSHF